jgi:hypothetical protein
MSNFYCLPGRAGGSPIVLEPMHLKLEDIFGLHISALKIGYMI